MDYHLDAEQIRFFDDNGYLILRDRIGHDLLGRLQEACDRMIATGKAAGPDDPNIDDYRFADRDQGRTMFRVDYLHNKDERSTLELLGAPEMLGIAESLAGPNFVPTYESLVFKEKGDGAVIPWHQDAVHPRNYRIFNVDVYLDPSRIGAGALRVAPGSHRAKVDICDLQGKYGWDAPGVIQVEMEPGDILIHDVMVVHGSEAVVGKQLRRTIYYEFRAAEQILSEGPWDREWVDNRLRLMPLALDAYRDANPDLPGFDWNISDEYRPEVLSDVDVELKIIHYASTPSSFCSAGDVPLPV